MRELAVTVAEGATFLTNLVTKVLGLTIAADQLLIKPHASSIAMGVATVFVAGGEVVERVVISIVDRLMEGGGPQAPAEPPPGRRSARGSQQRPDAGRKK